MLLRYRLEKMHPRGLKWRWQRSKRGWSDFDAWSFDSHLAQVIAGGVGALERNLHGHPGNLASVEEWGAILAKIRAGFEVYVDGEDWNDPRVQESVSLLATWFPHLWD